MADFKELFEEFKSVVFGNYALVDSVLPPILFFIVNAVFGFSEAVWVSLGAGLFIAVLRIIRGQKLWYALAGLGAALLAVGLRFLLDRTEAFFLPTIISGGLTTVIFFLSILIKRPAVAFTSHIARQWPLEWYWHPKVRPAYSEVTAFWAFFSAIKLAGQVYFYLQGDTDALALFNLVTGWPALIILLAFSYIYGLRRLKKLEGPSVEEFKENSPPPWEGQSRGF